MEPIIVVAALIMFIAATVQGIAGFGRALIAAPLIALFTPADETVVVMITLGFIGAMVMVIKKPIASPIANSFIKSNIESGKRFPR